jgi:hypothetical protein
MVRGWNLKPLCLEEVPKSIPRDNFYEIQGGNTECSGRDGGWVG